MHCYFTHYSGSYNIFHVICTFIDQSGIVISIVIFLLSKQFKLFDVGCHSLNSGNASTDEPFVGKGPKLSIGTNNNSIPALCLFCSLSILWLASVSEICLCNECATGS